MSIILARQVLSLLTIGCILIYILSLIDRSIIFSAFRLERHMRHKIYNDCQGHTFNLDPFLHIKLFQVVRALAMMVHIFV